ncbi:MAG: hypothetical protein DMG81_10840, partial [Acidobacteria bacterium]
MWVLSIYEILVELLLVYSCKVRCTNLKGLSIPRDRRLPALEKKTLIQWAGKRFRARISLLALFFTVGLVSA